MTKKVNINSKVAEVEKAIKAKEAELASIIEEKRTVTDNAIELVAVEKRERRAKSELEALQTAYKAVTYTPPEPTDQQELLQGLEKYQKQWNNRVNTIKSKIAEVDAEAIEIEKALEQATMAADTERAIDLSNRRNENKATRVHLSDMLERAEQIPVYSREDIKHEWEKICNEIRPEWDNKIMVLKKLTEAYKSAVTSLSQLNSTLKSVRKVLESKQGGEWLESSFTNGETGSDMVIDNSYRSQVWGVFSTITSNHNTL